MMGEIIDSKEKKQRKYRNIIFSIAFLLIILLTIGIFTFGNYRNAKQELEKDNHLNEAVKTEAPKKKRIRQPVAITPDTEEIIDTMEDTFSTESLDEPEMFSPPAVTETAESTKLSAVYIPQTRSLLSHSQSKNSDNIQAGKVYYQDENGKLESTIKQYNNGICEELISYDSFGNIVDKLEIGYISDVSGYAKSAVIFKNKISIYEIKNGNHKNDEIVTEYFISPQMKFSKGKTYTKL